MTHENETVNQPEGDGDTTVTVTTKCLDIVEQYRAGIIYKGDAIYEFAKAIPVGEDVSEESPGKTLESYIAMLDDWDRECTISDADEHREEAQDEKHSSNAGGRRHKRVERDVRLGTSMEYPQVGTG
jgi:hypothetical protein